MKQEPEQLWWTAAEIAAAAFPNMPATKRGVTMQAERQEWQRNPDLARRRKGKGGGWEYHWVVLSYGAQQQLIRAAVNAAPIEPVSADVIDRDAAWEFYDSLPEHVKEKAKHRLKAVQYAEGLGAGDMPLDDAIYMAGQEFGVSAKTIYNWRTMIEGVSAHDRLAYIAPRNRLASRKRDKRVLSVDPDFGELIKSHYLIQSKPPLTAAYDWAVRIAEDQKIPTVPLSKVRRWLKKEVSPSRLVYLRQGPDALKRLYPPQTRDKTAMHAMEGVNGDFHKFDVFVEFPANRNEPAEILRPQMVAFQDIYSGRLLCYRVAKSANSHTVQQSIGDMIESWGIPKHVLLDNGREFVAKSITGGTKSPFRYRYREEDVPGLLTAMGCEIHWAKPYSGQSKPIERAFRDLCDRVAKHPSFEGAYTGNKPDAKPENYRSKAIRLADFLEVLRVEIEHHNMRPGRRSEVAFGRSFAEVFDESYANAPIKMATPEQRRFWLMGIEGVRAASANGAVKLLGNSYWADWMHRIAGQKIVARFDRAALWDGIHVYDADNAYLGHAPCTARGKFFDTDDASIHERNRTAWLRQEKAAAKAHKRFTAAEVAAQHAALPNQGEQAPVEAKVVAPDFKAETTRRAAEQAPALPDQRAHEDRIIADLTSRIEARDEADDAADEMAKFRRALEIEDMIERGAPATKDQRVFLENYQRSSEYRGKKLMHEQFGDDMFVGRKPQRGSK